MKKAVIFILIILTLISISIAYYYYNEYTISPNMLENDIYNRFDMDIEIQKYKFDKNHMYLLFTAEQNIGFAIYEKTFLNRYSRVKIGYKTEFYNYDLYKYNNSTIITVIGKNLCNKIDYFIIHAGSKNIKEYVKSEYFLYKYDLLEDDFSLSQDVFDIRFYDKNNIDITSELYYLNQMGK